jgi:hypothetical protein
MEMQRIAMGIHPLGRFYPNHETDQRIENSLFGLDFLMAIQSSGIPEPQRIDIPVSAGAVVLISLYLAAQMLADVASLKIGLVAGLSVDMGTFIYPITFTLRDLVHKTLGKRAARTLILTAGGVNLFMALYLLGTALVPEDPAWGLGAEFSAVFSPVWRIVLASIIAEVLSELADTEVYHWFVTRVTRKRLWLRVLISNSVSVPIDNAIFAVGAFGFSLPWATVKDIFFVNLFVKFAVTLLSIPLIYLGRDADLPRKDGN